MRRKYHISLISYLTRVRCTRACTAGSDMSHKAPVHIQLGSALMARPIHRRVLCASASSSRHQGVSRSQQLACPESGRGGRSGRVTHLL